MTGFLSAVLLFFLLIMPAFGLTVEKIEVEGLKWTKKKFVLRELLFKPGDEFSEQKLKKSVRNLLNTHLFYKVVPQVERVGNGVVVRLKLKEKFPIVPLPRLRLKTSGSYRAGLELRDYNLLGMGHRLSVGYLKWFNSKEESHTYYGSLNLYRVIRNRANVYAGFDYSSLEESRELSLPFGIHFYLDSKKVNQLSLGLDPTFLRHSGNDRNVYYVTLSYTRDLSTDMVYYVKGGTLSVWAVQSLPQASDVSTGTVGASYENSVHVRGTETYVYSLSTATKLGYCGEDFKVAVPVPGFKEDRTVGKRYLTANFGWRKPLIDKSVYAIPRVFGGITNRHFLTSFGLEVTAFWVRIADGIIRFKVFRGIGEGSDTQTNLRLTFRW